MRLRSDRQISIVPDVSPTPTPGLTPTDRQFFVTEVPYASLNGGYTIFGQCDEAAVELVKKIARMQRDPNDLPSNPVKITHIEIQGAAAKSETHRRPDLRPEHLTPAKRRLMTRTPGTYAVFETSEGTIVCRLFEKDAPKTVANFVELAEGKREWTHPSTRKKTTDPLYDGTIFHRVIPDFMIQGGDPQGTGMGGPGYQFEDETKGSPHRFDEAGQAGHGQRRPEHQRFAVLHHRRPTPTGSPASTPSSARWSKATRLWKKSRKSPAIDKTAQQGSGRKIGQNRTLILPTRDCVPCSAG